MALCKRCGEYQIYADCGCSEFSLITEEGEECTIFAIDEQAAALKYAQRSNENGDYYLMNDSVEIYVSGKKFMIGAEPDIHYSAREI